MIKIHITKKAFSRIDYKKLGKQAREVFDLLSIKDGELELNFVRTDKMRKINKSFRGKDESTTILSFVASETRDFIEPSENKDYLGEIFMCVSEIKKKAKSEEISTESLMTRYLVHGILHLLGRIHDTKESLLKMEAEEDQILAALNVKS